MTRILDSAQKWIAFDEGCELRAYYDSIGGLYTIGYGHTGRDVQRDTVWTQARADSVFAHDLLTAQDRAAQIVGEAYYALLSPVCAAAFTNMTFNLGFKLEDFTTFLKLARATKWRMAAADLLGNTLWAKQLPARAHRVAIALATNEWPEVA